MTFKAQNIYYSVLHRESLLTPGVCDTSLSRVKKQTTELYIVLPPNNQKKNVYVCFKQID